MASSGKQKTTWSKIQREGKLREKRAEKAARKAARKDAQYDTLSTGGLLTEEPGLEPDTAREDAETDESV